MLLEKLWLKQLFSAESGINVNGMVSKTVQSYVIVSPL